MRSLKLVFLAGMALACLSVPSMATQEATPEPTQRYRVTGVASGDVLNMRAQPSASSGVVGTLSPNESGLVVAGTRMETNGSVWWQVIGEGGPGWVNARYLAPDGAPSGDETFPLVCTGTEPFWSVTVIGGEARFETPDGAETWQAGPMTSAAGMTGRYAARLESGGGVGHLAAWRNHNFCSDGMSDIGFPYEGIVIAPDGTIYGGCCQRAGE